MAKREAELTIADLTVNLNIYLSNFTGRTVEAVKEQRGKGGAYRALVTEYLESLPRRGVPQPAAPQVAGLQEDSNAPDPGVDPNEGMRQ